MRSAVLALVPVLCLLGPNGAAQQWTPLDPIGDARQASTAWDPIRQRLVLYGGGSGHYGRTWTDPWIWDGESWIPFAHRGDSPRPDGITASAIAWDGRNQRILMFGGARLSPFSISNETWAFTGDQWLQLQPAHRPPGRHSHAMAYDEARQRVVMNGGFDVSARSDTWEWDGTDWIERPGSGPPTAFNHGMCYDRARQRIVFLGGLITNAGQTWEWDGTTWRFVTNLPPHHAKIAYDTQRRRVVLFGGSQATNQSADTWEYDGTSWVERTPASAPAARSGNALGYDEARQRVVMYGGALLDPRTARDTWLWDGTTWTTVPAPARPEAFEGAMMAPFFENAAHRVMLFGGGRLDSRMSDQTWIWHGANWELKQPVTRPAARQYGAMAYDTKRRRIVLFGGIAQNTNQPFDDTWEWDGQVWLLRTPSTRPRGRSRHAMVYDQARERVVLVGGLANAPSVRLDDHWEWDGDDWRERSPVALLGLRSGHAMAYSEFRRRIVLFGGVTNIFGLADTLEWDGTSWALRTPSTVPQGRENHVMCFDAGSGRVLMHGGIYHPSIGPLLGDTWEWDGNDWAAKTSERAPTGRYGHAMAYDFGRRRPLLFGGRDPNPLDDTWFLSPTRSAVTLYGTPCFRPAGLLQLAALGVPRIGAGTGVAGPLALELAGANPSSPIAIALALGPDARAFGACTLWIGAPFHFLQATSSATGFASLPLPLPGELQLRGLEIFTQAMTPEAGSLALSGGLKLVIGD